MRAMLLRHIRTVEHGMEPLEAAELPQPEPAADELLLRVLACGVCHTELDEIEGRTPPPRLPVVPGHQIVGEVVAAGGLVHSPNLGQRVGVAWIGSACGRCEPCQRGTENLCADFIATGRDRDGGYAEYATVRADFAVPVPDALSDRAAAPLLCAGAIGHRSLTLTGLTDRRSLGLTGFGASAHLVLQMAQYRFPESPIFVFARSEEERLFALELGAAWAGDTDDAPPEQLDAIIDTTPAWRPVLAALTALRPGGRLVINAIRKEDRDRGELAEIDYASQLWLEKEIKSVANVTRLDVAATLALAAEIPLRPETEIYTLEEANQALVELKTKRIRGAKVLQIG
jgi:propanol-preferring alcohol dehydrogenase